MKKFLFLMTLLFSSLVSVNAQIATQNSNALDNVYVGVTGGVSTPLDFNSVFPLNANAGLVVGKEFNPYVGMNVEGLAMFNDNHFADAKTFVKATNVGVNGTLNLSNAFAGYKGTPRAVELGAVAGFGWLHVWDAHTNFLTAKTGLDLKFNLGSKKAHTIMITPAVYWNLNKIGNVKFNKNHAQLAVNVTYVYHFKTSNGTHHFKTYDVGAMISEIDRLNSELAKKPTEIIVEKVVIKEVPQPAATNAVAVADAQNEWGVKFAFNSAELTDEAKAVLDEIAAGTEVDLSGFASPEGNGAYNDKLSQKRADAVAKYLESKGVKVKSALGKGVPYTRTVEIKTAK
jgi:outer membrane protein OmpA-like peptidoglycan-associated protein